MFLMVSELIHWLNAVPAPSTVWALLVLIEWGALKGPKSERWGGAPERGRAVPIARLGNPEGKWGSTGKRKWSSLRKDWRELWQILAQSEGSAKKRRVWMLRFVPVQLCSGPSSFLHLSTCCSLPGSECEAVSLLRSIQVPGSPWRLFLMTPAIVGGVPGF